MTSVIKEWAQDATGHRECHQRTAVRASHLRWVWVMNRDRGVTGSQVRGQVLGTLTSPQPTPPRLQGESGKGRWQDKCQIQRTWHSYYSHQRTTAMIPCKRPAEDQGSKVPAWMENSWGLLTKELLAVDSYWEEESFPLRVWLLIGFPCSVDGPSPAHIRSMNWTRRVLEKK